jgi:DNA transformation protein
MAVSESFLTFVTEQLASVRDVSTKRMFGGVGLYSVDTFFAIIDNDTVFFKVDAATVGRYTRRKMPPFQPMPDRPPMMGYYQVPLAVLEDPDALGEWAAEAIEVGRRAPAKKKPTSASGASRRRRQSSRGTPGPS